VGYLYFISLLNINFTQAKINQLENKIPLDLKINLSETLWSIPSSPRKAQFLITVVVRNDKAKAFAKETQELI
jgi:hypothetical protein